MLVFLPQPAGTTACTVGISRLSLSGLKVLERPLNQSSSSVSLKKKKKDSKQTNIYRDREDRTKPDCWNWLRPDKRSLLKSSSVWRWGLSGRVWPWQNVVTLWKKALRPVEAFKCSWRRMWRRSAHPDRLRMFFARPRETKASSLHWALPMEVLIQCSSVHL